MYKDSVQVVKINERLSQTHLCLDQALILDLDVNVKYKGDYVLYGYIDFDEGLPSEIARLETRTVNGIRTWPYCDDQQRDASGKCPSLLHLDPGQNRISVEFHGFAKRLIKLEKAGSFPLEMSARIIIHRERGFLERLFIKTGAFVKNDRISIEEYDVLYQSGDAYRTNHYDFRTILARCINDNVYGR